MLEDADKLHILFEILDELSSAKGHEAHYKDLYHEQRKILAIRMRQLRTAISMLYDKQYESGVMGVCAYCGYKPHHSSCELDALFKDMDYAAEHGIEGYGVDGKRLS